ncbi:MAG: HNH endonuclease [Polyangiales bacterium]
MKHRDGHRCLCCGDDNARYLQVDHVVSFHHGGSNEMENLQTLCARCNGDKGINEENFRRTETLLVSPRAEFSVKHEPGATLYRDADAWRRCVRATLNHYFRCAAVRDVTVGARGAPFYEWAVTLYPGNDPKLVQPHLAGLLTAARERRRGGGADSPEAIVVEGYDASSVGWRVRVTTEGTTAALLNKR